MKKAMISQPMGGLSETEILTTRARAIKKLEALGYEVVNSYFGNIPDCKPLFILGRYLEVMSECDAVFFCYGWQEKRGCRVEREAALEYGLKVIDEID